MVGTHPCLTLSYFATRKQYVADLFYGRPAYQRRQVRRGRGAGSHRSGEQGTGRARGTLAVSAFAPPGTPQDESGLMAESYIVHLPRVHPSAPKEHLPLPPTPTISRPPPSMSLGFRN